jgi:hypothetical protein
MFKFTFWRSSTTVPITLKALHTLHLLLTIPAFPLTLLIFLALLLGAAAFLITGPFALSSFTTFVLLCWERSAAKKTELTRHRYLRLQTLKLVWTVFWYAPLILTAIFTVRMKLALAAVLLHDNWFWKMIIWFNGLHW